MKHGDNRLPVLAEQINAEHSNAEIALSKGVEHAARTGQLLIEAKSLVKHGEWTQWLKSNCQFSERTAQGYMRLSKKISEGKAQRVADLSLRAALTELADPHISEMPIPPLGKWLRGVISREDGSICEVWLINSDTKPHLGHKFLHMAVFDESGDTGHFVDYSIRPIRTDAVPPALENMGFDYKAAQWTEHEDEPEGVAQKMFRFAIEAPICGNP